MKIIRRNRIWIIAILIAVVALATAAGTSSGGRADEVEETVQSDGSADTSEKTEVPETAETPVTEKQTGRSSDIPIEAETVAQPAGSSASGQDAEEPDVREGNRKYIFIGDSRTCCIANAVYGTNAWTLGSMILGWYGDDYFACQFGAHLWEQNGELVNNAINMIGDNTSVFLLMGRNDIVEPQDLYVEEYNKKLAEIVRVAQTKKNTQVFFVCVGPDQGYDRNQFAVFNDAVYCDGVEKLDPWSSLSQITYQTDIPGDLHYSSETSAELYHWLKDKAEQANAAVAKATVLSAVITVQERIRMI